MWYTKRLIKSNRLLKEELKELKIKLANYELEIKELEEEVSDRDLEIRELKSIISKSIINCFHCSVNIKNEFQDKFVKKMDKNNMDRIEKVCELWKNISSVHHLDVDDYELKKSS